MLQKTLLVGFSGMALILSTAPARVSEPPAPLPPVPTSQQLAWQRMETNLFVHLTVNTFTGREWGDGKESPSVFYPQCLDARQWARAAKAAGFRMLILTAKHHDGFCLWPTATTDHSVKYSPWKKGKGDVVADVARACRAEGLKLGLYLSPWDRHEPSYGYSDRYNAFYRAQLTELLTRYGPIAEVWFDGANGEGPNGKRQVYDFAGYHALIRRLQPEALIFSDAGPDIRWIGNEQGTAGDPNWAMVDPEIVRVPGQSGPGVTEALQHGNQHGSVWRPGECDVSIRPGWFWHPEEEMRVRTVENLVDLYFRSVGRNAVLLLNVPPNRDGRFSDTDVARLREFRQRLDAIFRTDFAEQKPVVSSNTRGNDAVFSPRGAVDRKEETFWAVDDTITSAWLEVDLLRPTVFNVARVQEHISLGQRVSAWRLDILEGERWNTIARGKTIGYKRLERFPSVTAKRVRLVIEQSRACPVISGFGLFRDEQAP